MGAPKRACNAEKHGMDGRVTPRAIAYAAAHVCVSRRLSVSPPNSHSPAALQPYRRHPLDEPL